MIELASGVQLLPIQVSPNSDYMAGSDGHIYSRTKYKGFGKKVYVEWYPLKGAKTRKGYPSVSLCHENKKVTKSVHRLICMAFHGLPTTETMQVRHLDGNPENNVPENLEWGTQYENWEDRKMHGRVNYGEDHHAAKLTNLERDHLRWAIQKGLCSMRQAARALNMSSAAISAIVNTSQE